MSGDLLQLGIRQPPHIRTWCACGIRIDALDHPDLIAHALRVHHETPEHQQWRRAQEHPHFAVEVRER